ncbi:cytosolic carboxypeptidase-like protein 5 [Orussus abietinus]|uniref:cytosolic carboxypeptidase-like protein 5 n=1 Tax=Orussus abietinus TaxID=222816 RepID=UPI000626044E|nr:cytosolic carboxypeptidase-like protein 5 [Orussus abietinus]XP_012271374.1 cytosolic carboxypeptidase-like protein 5 [Orussus abietinus]XP_012271376.1 cytosolic carboxypeptidase-like protein 5 [Orussus abietinus]
MAGTLEGITCGGFTFFNNFDSSNLAKVEQVDKAPHNDSNEGNSNNLCSDDSPEYEFNLWTKRDCHGTEYQNNNRTWFYFGVRAVAQGVQVKLNIVNLNNQVRMFSQGMCPVFKTVPGHPHWERIREKPTYTLDQKGNEFILSFVHHASENPKAITYFAFTYPFTYTDLQNYLKRIDARMAKRNITTADDIYYHRECAIKSLEGRTLDLLTISSHHNISTEREARLTMMFPEKDEVRPFKFRNKKVIFISARVHPGETPSSFVFNGFLNYLLNREDQIAIILRRLYVFKMIPMLNPDGVVRGHYRMDTRGVNLNRVYLNPSIKDHPTIYAARNLIRYYHNFYRLPEEEEKEREVKSTDSPTTDINLSVNKDKESSIPLNTSEPPIKGDTANELLQQVTLMTLNEEGKRGSESDIEYECLKETLENTTHRKIEGRTEMNENMALRSDCEEKIHGAIETEHFPADSEPSGLFLYIDLHGHASKKGVFMYGNYFNDPEDTITCMLLPKLMSINNPNFHFTSCNFTERNMYLTDKKDGMSREGSGRVAVYKMTGLVRSYTLECNYNSGRLVNCIPARIRDGVNKTHAHIFVPPKYTPTVFEEVGAALGPSILDLTNSNPNSRLPNSQHRSLRGVRSYLKLTYASNFTASFSRPLHKNKSGASAQDSFLVKSTESSPSCIPEDSSSSETDVPKKPCTVRRTASLYAVTKKLKASKKPKQLIIRKTLKNQDTNRSENAPPPSTSKSIPVKAKKKLFKAVEPHVPFDSNPEHVRPSFVPRPKKCKPPMKKDMAGESLQQPIIVEETTAIRQGSKRLKVISPKLARPRGEASISETSSTKTEEKLILKAKPAKKLVARKRTVEKSTSKIPTRVVFSYKQNSKGTHGRSRKQALKIDQTKSKRPTKIKPKKKKSIRVLNNVTSGEITG